ncbi:DUF5518 domain-containing protein [Haloarcula salina]|uniref:DUF5518 domain-containing protein n=1 Tax=Haloarcula salina TaxID=1429914 RepID=A0AA41FYR8_9EURY|nr:DUF5518 domain-containing protein [Haloarcula salina]MBV0901071.1 DUF5518 domain-containing protein [Haloarcula salina]
MGDGDTLLNVVIGAIATAVLGGFVPFAPLFGGALAGYLQGGTRDDAVRVGLLSGVFGLVGTVLVTLFVLLVLSVFLAFSPEALAAVGAVGVLFLIASTLTAAAYFLGLSALGGWLGNYVRYDTDLFS